MRLFLQVVFCFLCFVFFGLPAWSQLCTGSLGDPIVNQTFGNGSPGPPLSAATTSYNYINVDCPNDGMYALRSTTVNCYNSWHSLVSDHTGDPQGNFMLVNASFEPGDFYIDTVRGLCANTGYQFSAWVMNMMRPQQGIRPNITFSIEKTDGTVLGSFSSGDVPVTTSPQWNNYGLFFKTPSATFDLVVRMRNNAPGGAGNDIALDDITFRPCGPQISVQISGRGEKVDFCETDTASLLLTSEISAGYINSIYQWQVSTDGGVRWLDIAGANSLFYVRKRTGAGKYLYRLSVVENENMNIVSCRITSPFVTINVHAKPIVDAGPDRTILKGERTLLEGKITGDSILFAWEPQVLLENAGSLTPIVTASESTTYILKANSVWGCSNQDSVFVKVIDDIYIPTAFTPNGDGLNDLWRIPDLDPSIGAEVWVFNRYGEIVYYSKGATVAWDGKLHGKRQAGNVFVYLVDLKKGKPHRKGIITLIR